MGEAVAAAVAVVAAVDHPYLGAVADDQRHVQERALPRWVGLAAGHDPKSTAHRAVGRTWDVPRAGPTSVGQPNDLTSTVPAEA